MNKVTRAERHRSELLQRKMRKKKLQRVVKAAAKETCEVFHLVSQVSLLIYFKLHDLQKGFVDPLNFQYVEQQSNKGECYGGISARSMSYEFQEATFQLCKTFLGLSISVFCICI